MQNSTSKPLSIPIDPHFFNWLIPPCLLDPHFWPLQRPFLCVFYSCDCWQDLCCRKCFLACSSHFGGFWGVTPRCAPGLARLFEAFALSNSGQYGSKGTVQRCGEQQFQAHYGHCRNVNPGLINPGWLIVVVPPNSDKWLLNCNCQGRNRTCVLIQHHIL